MTAKSREELLQDADAAIAQLDWPLAAELLAQAGTDSFVLDKRVFILSRAKRYDEALELLAELRKREPSKARHYYMTGSQYYERELYSEAIAWFEQGLQLDSSHLKMWWRKAYSLHRIGREPDAHAAAARVLQLWPTMSSEQQERWRSVRAKAAHLLGKAYLADAPHLALPLLEQASADAPNDPFNLYAHGKALRLVGRSAEAVHVLRSARALSPADPHIQLELAEALCGTKDREAALAILGRLSNRLRSWEAFKAARLAQRLDAVELALRLVKLANQDRAVRSDKRAKALTDDLVSAAGTVTDSGAYDSTATCIGKVSTLRTDRGFGFLVEEQTGTRRHFRIKPHVKLQPGDRVRFEPVAAEKGPAARVISRA